MAQNETAKVPNNDVPSNFSAEPRLESYRTLCLVASLVAVCPLRCRDSASFLSVVGSLCMVLAKTACCAAWLTTDDEKDK